MPEGTRVVVTGGRKFADMKLLTECMDYLLSPHAGNIECLIHGDCSGADQLAGSWARSRGVAERRFPVTDADWKRYGKAAGPMRNQQMIDEGRPHVGVAFPGGDGTQDMVDRLIAAGVPVCVPQWTLQLRFIDISNVVYPQRL